MTPTNSSLSPKQEACAKAGHGAVQLTYDGWICLLCRMDLGKRCEDMLKARVPATEEGTDAC